VKMTRFLGCDDGIMPKKKNRYIKMAYVLFQTTLMRNGNLHTSSYIAFTVLTIELYRSMLYNSNSKILFILHRHSISPTHDLSKMKTVQIDNHKHPLTITVMTPVNAPA